MWWFILVHESKNDVMIFIGRPNPEIAPAYAKYYFDRTIGQDNLMDALIKDQQKVIAFIGQIPEDKIDFHYADDKWSLKGVLLHVIETERVFNTAHYGFLAKTKPQLKDLTKVGSANTTILTHERFLT